MTFHFMFAHIILSSVWVAEWPPFGKELLTRFLWFSVGIFGFRVSVTFHFMFAHIILSSVLVAEWPPFGKDLLTRLTICSLFNLTIFNFGYFPFWF